jgi:hypothetical protein
LAGLELDREEEDIVRFVEERIGPVELRVDRAVEAYIVLDPAKQLVGRVVVARTALGQVK